MPSLMQESGSSVGKGQVGEENLRSLRKQSRISSVQMHYGISFAYFVCVFSFTKENFLW